MPPPRRPPRSAGGWPPPGPRPSNPTSLAVRWYAFVRAAGKADLTLALTVAEGAVTLNEALATRRPLALTDDLAGALTTLADVLDGLDRSAAADGPGSWAPRDSRRRRRRG